MKKNSNNPQISYIERVGEIRTATTDTWEEENKIFDYQTKSVKNNIFIWSIYVVWVVAIVLLITRLWHFVMPHNLLWLDEQQVGSLDKLLFSGTIGTILGRFGGRIFETLK